MVRRRQNYDPLLPIPAVTWLVTQDKFRNVLEFRELAAGTDLRAVLTAEREKRIADGWVAPEIGPVSSTFFCTREGERIEVGIMRRDPRLPMTFR